MTDTIITRIDRILKRDDLRGIYPNELNEEIAYYIGRAIVHILCADKKDNTPHFVIGWDMRLSSPSLSKALTRGLVYEGSEVHEIGQCGTELVYFAVGADHTKTGGIMVTASHNGKDQNGFKIVKRGGEPTNADELRRIVARVKYFSQERGAALIQEYAKLVLRVSRIRRDSKHQLRIVIESGSGMGAMMFHNTTRDLGYLDVIYSHPQPDGSFPVGVPNPLKTSYMQLLASQVVKAQADLGLAFDGDADRIGVVDGNGEVVQIAELISIIAEQFLQQSNVDRKIMYNIACSRLVPDIITHFGGIPWMTPVGYGQIKQRMRKPEHSDCVFAGEHSGHFFFRDFFQGDSGMIAALMIVEATLAAKAAGSNLHDKVSGWRQKYFSSAEVNFNIRLPNPHITEAEERQLMQECVQRVWLYYAHSGKKREQYAPNDPLQVSHGVDLLTMEFSEDFGSWWFYLRPSGNEPLLRLFIEVVLQEAQPISVDGRQLMEARFNTLVDLIGRKYIEAV
jgi:phosphomannomutase